MLKKYIRVFFIFINRVIDLCWFVSYRAIDFFDIATPLRRARACGEKCDEHPGQYVFG